VFFIRNFVPVDKCSATLLDAIVRDALYGECADEDLTLARMLLLPEPTRPLATAATVAEASFGQLSRVYIEILKDRALPCELQKQMYTALRCHAVMSLDTDHRLSSHDPMS
jgi:hypothetical protein